MKVLALGGGGFIGSHMIDHLLRDTPHEVIAYDLYDEKIEDFKNNPRLTYLHGDIRKEHGRLEELIQDADVVVDLIAHANPSLYVSIPLEVFELNFDENLVIARLCVKHNKRLVQFSTCEVYGMTPAVICGDDLKNPDDPKWATFHEDRAPLIMGPVENQRWIYACAKQLLERILHAYGLQDAIDYTIIRPFNFIGPKIDYLPSEEDGNPRVFSHFTDCLRTGKDFHLVDGGQQKRSYTYIADAADCIVKIVEDKNHNCNKHIFNIGTPGNETTIQGFAERMTEVYKESGWWDGVSKLPGFKHVSGEEFYGKGYEDCDRRIPDISKAQQLVGWEPKYDLRSTIYHSMAYWFEGEGVKEAEAAAAKA